MTIIERIADELAKIQPDIPIYTENQSNGFDVPSFYISRAGAGTIMPRTWNYEDRKYSYQVVYFANEDNPNEDLERMETILMDNFTVLSEYSYLRNREFTIDSNEHTLICLFDLNLHMYREDRTPKQKRLDVNANTKEEGN